MLKAVKELQKELFTLGQTCYDLSFEVKDEELEGKLEQFYIELMTLHAKLSVSKHVEENLKKAKEVLEEVKKILQAV